jgi:hypothetical protein
VLVGIDAELDLDDERQGDAPALLDGDDGVRASLERDVDTTRLKAPCVPSCRVCILAGLANPWGGADKSELARAGAPFSP